MNDKPKNSIKSKLNLVNKTNLYPDEYDPESIYAKVGGEKYFEKLVNDFYYEVQKDEILMKMYPKEDIDGAKKRLSMFLSQYWGGPKTYSYHRGHPRLRMRHNIYPINNNAAMRWLKCMNSALDKNKVDETIMSSFQDYFLMAAHSLINKYETY